MCKEAKVLATALSLTPIITFCCSLKHLTGGFDTDNIYGPRMGVLYWTINNAFLCDLRKALFLYWEYNFTVDSYLQGEFTLCQTAIQLKSAVFFGEWWNLCSFWLCQRIALLFSLEMYCKNVSINNRIWNLLCPHTRTILGMLFKSFYWSRNGWRIDASF